MAGLWVAVWVTLRAVACVQNGRHEQYCGFRCVGGGRKPGCAAGAGTFEYFELSGKSHFFGREQAEILACCVALLEK